MKVISVAALLATASLAVPAQAESLTGFRVEGRIGWESVSASTQIPNPDDDEDEDGDELLTVSDDENGINYGIEAGYDFPVGEWMTLGAYGGVELSDMDRCAEIAGDDLGCVGTGRNFTAGVRAGFAVSPTFLVYAKGGYSNGKVEFSYDSDVEEEDPLDADFAEASRTRDGYHLGGGVELAFTSALYGKVEYVYTDYGTARFLSADEDLPGAAVGLSRHQVSAGIGLRF
ncbi:outer membrane protein [Sphingosinicella sp. CPCC 101087]|uniref:outer membrane protein n=1 Tax=Sphingosinicella sp. CPCC 101087 TaxID=2497754 RepID=UPI00101C4CF0|nr:outer membrane beta-barrel protein [Sphingosinicella sp. CPCC 101087]